jgi:hypothetical protein
MWETLCSAGIARIQCKSLTNRPSVQLMQSFRPKRAFHWCLQSICTLWQGTNNPLSHSVNQFKHFGIIVDDSACQFANGKLCLETPDGYFIPISISNCLPYIDIHPPMDEELEAYPQVNFTPNMPWEPQVFDNEYDL